MKPQTDWDALRAKLADVELVDSDDENLDSDWHRCEIDLLIGLSRHHYHDRADCYVSGNMFIYFDEESARQRNFRGPDFFLVWGRPRQPMRRWWAVWDEGGHFPNVIIELLSPATEHEDRTRKFEVYERQFQTPEYFLYDPFANVLEGYRLSPSLRYTRLVPNERGQLWSEELQLWIGTWYGLFGCFETTWLRFFKPDGQLVLTEAESYRQQAEGYRRQTEEHLRRIEEYRKQEETERQRADALAAEVERLKALLGSPPAAGA